MIISRTVNILKIATKLSTKVSVASAVRRIQKNAETVLFSAICGVRPFCSVIRLGKPCKTYILIIKSLRTDIFASPIFVLCMVYNIILRFAFYVQMEIEWLHIDSLILSNANLQIFFEIIAYLPVNNHQ